MRGGCHLLLALALSGCAPPPAAPGLDRGEVPAGFPERAYLEAAQRGERVFRVDAALSLVVVEVRRGGSLGALGHDHVVAVRDLHGYVAPDARRADLLIALDGLSVDEPALRERAGFDTRPSADDVAATRENMHARVLETRRFPYAGVRIDGPAADGTLDVAITLHGVTQRMAIPARIEGSARALEASGRLALSQRDFGIAPFAVLGGALRVDDAVAITFRIRASAADIR